MSKSSHAVERCAKPKVRRPQPLEAAAQPDALLTIETTVSVTGISRSAIYRAMAEQTFPAPVRISPRCVRWKARSVREWMAAQQAGAKQ